MAEVTSKQRERTEQRTGDSSFPMETAAQIRSAIKLRGRGASKSSSEVLRLATSAVSRLLAAGKITQSTADSLRAAIAQARERDNMSIEHVYLRDDYVSLVGGEPFRLLPVGRLVKGGKEWNLTPEFLRRFRLPHYKPPIKLGAHKDETPAGGFITGLEVREDGLYAIPEYNDEGAAAIEKGAYRYHSPEVIWDGALEDPEGGLIEGPIVVGDALLHSPHLGERAALYSVEPIDGGRRMDETMTVPVSWFERLLGKEPKPEPEQQEQPPKPVGVEPEKFEALQAERDEMAAKIQAMEAERALAQRVDHFEAELKPHVAVGDDPELYEALAELQAHDEALAEYFTVKIKALAAQIQESNLTSDVGNSGDVDDGLPPSAKLDKLITAKMEADGVDYNAAVVAIMVEQPELFQAWRGAR